MVPALFCFLVSGPACYLVLDSYTDIGLLHASASPCWRGSARFAFFGWQVNLRGERAEKHAWRNRGPARGSRLPGAQGFQRGTEFMVLARRLLAEDSQLRTMLLAATGTVNRGSIAQMSTLKYRN
jgi:hypothetical protein